MAGAIICSGCAQPYEEEQVSLVQVGCSVYGSGQTLDAETFEQFSQMTEMSGSLRTCNSRDVRLAKRLAQISLEEKGSLAFFLEFFYQDSGWFVQDQDGHIVQIEIISAYSGIYEELRSIKVTFDEGCQEVISCCSKQMSSDVWKCKNGAFCM